MRETTRIEWMGRMAAATLAAAAFAACGGAGQAGGEGGTQSVPSIGGLTESGFLARVAMADGSVQLVTNQGPVGFSGLRSIARDPGTGTVYGIGSTSSTAATVLVRIDPTPGPDGLERAPEPIAEVPYPTPSNLVWHPDEQMLYGVANGAALAPSRLVRIDPSTGTTEIVGECARATTLTYDHVTEAFYGVGNSGFYRIRPSDGASLMLFSESAYLPKVRALALDPVAGVFVGVFHDQATEPGIVSIDLFGQVDEVASIDDTLVDLERDPTTGEMLALSNGGSIARVDAGSPAYAVTHLGNVGHDLFDFTIDPADGGYYGVDRTNHLVKFRAGGACRTLGRLAVPTRQVVFDSAAQQLWGIGSEFIYTSSASYVYPIDRATAATGTPVLASVSAGSRVAYDSTHGALRAISGANGVTLELDPLTGNTVLTANAASLGDVQALAWDPAEERLVAAWTNSSPGQTRFSVWDPFASGSVQQGLMHGDLGSLERSGTPGTFLGIGGSNELFEITLGTAGTQRTRGAVKHNYYRSTVYVPGPGRIFAATNDEVWSIDPASGASEFVGSTPSGDRPSGIGWDPERERLAFLIDDEIRWTSPSAPWHASTRTSLQGLDVEWIAFSPERGVFYLLGDDGLHVMALNASGASFVAVTTTAPPVRVKDTTWRDGALWAATNDGHLHRIDPDTGAWSDLGGMPFGMQGLH